MRFISDDIKNFKANPYHDENGRFTSEGEDSGGSGQYSSGGKINFGTLDTDNDFKAYLSDVDYPFADEITAKDLSGGLCSFVAAYMVQHETKDAVICAQFVSMGMYHAFAKIDGRYYDGDAPEGVGDPKDLPIYKNGTQPVSFEEYSVKEFEEAMFKEYEDAIPEGVIVDYKLKKRKKKSESIKSEIPKGQLAIPLSDGTIIWVKGGREFGKFINENEIINKENPYRDEYGRFTTEDNDVGGGGGSNYGVSIVSGSEHGEMSDNDFKDAKKIDDWLFLNGAHMPINVMGGGQVLSGLKENYLHYEEDVHDRNTGKDVTRTHFFTTSEGKDDLTHFATFDPEGAVGGVLHHFGHIDRNGVWSRTKAFVINNDKKNFEMKNETTTPRTHDELVEIGRKKIATHYKVKDGFETETKDVDFTKRIVKAIPNTYFWFDSDQDVLIPGSAAKTISERGPKSTGGGAKIKNVKDHVISDRIGIVQVLDERKVDEKEVMYGESKMLKTTLGNDMLIEYQEGVIDQHSIGFKYNDIQLVTADDKPWNSWLKQLINPKDAEKHGFMFIVKEVMQFEYSPVSFGSNVLTPYLGVKSGNKEAIQLKVFERLDLLNKQLRNGRQSDETMMDYELEILQLKQIISELFTEEPSIKATLLAERRHNKDTEQPNNENPIEVEGEVEDEKTKCIVTCPGCQKEFDWLSIEESGMGYVKCPSCTEPVTQEGKKWYDLIEVIKKTQFI